MRATVYRGWLHTQTDPHRAREQKETHRVKVPWDKDKGIGKRQEREHRGITQGVGILGDGQTSGKGTQRNHTGRGYPGRRANVRKGNTEESHRAWVSWETGKRQEREHRGITQGDGILGDGQTSGKGTQRNHTGRWYPGRRANARKGNTEESHRAMVSWETGKRQEREHRGITQGDGILGEGQTSGKGTQRNHTGRWYPGRRANVRKGNTEESHRARVSWETGKRQEREHRGITQGEGILGDGQTSGKGTQRNHTGRWYPGRRANAENGTQESHRAMVSWETGKRQEREHRGITQGDGILGDGQTSGKGTQRNHTGRGYPGRRANVRKGNTEESHRAMVSWETGKRQEREHRGITQGDGILGDGQTSGKGTQRNHTGRWYPGRRANVRKGNTEESHRAMVSWETGKRQEREHRGITQGEGILGDGQTSGKGTQRNHTGRWYPGRRANAENGTQESHRAMVSWETGKRQEREHRGITQGDGILGDGQTSGKGTQRNHTGRGYHGRRANAEKGTQRNHTGRWYPGRRANVRKGNTEESHRAMVSWEKGKRQEREHRGITQGDGILGDGQTPRTEHRNHTGRWYPGRRANVRKGNTEESHRAMVSWETGKRQEREHRGITQGEGIMGDGQTPRREHRGITQGEAIWGLVPHRE